VNGRFEVGAWPRVTYIGFVDPSGGSADSMTMAIAQSERDGRIIFDAMRDWKPPFSPDACVEEFCELLTLYGVSKVIGDRYGGQWPRERFRAHGAQYEPSERSKSEIYASLLPLLNSQRVELF